MKKCCRLKEAKVYDHGRDHERGEKITAKDMIGQFEKSEYVLHARQYCFNVTFLEFDCYTVVI